jgi:cytochrome d ubiquinol oxidase subunit I
VLLTSLAFKGMVALGTYFVLVTLYGFIRRKQVTESPWFLRIILFSIPLPYIANQLGWIVTEVGRQPWIVYGLMRTSDAASPVAASQVAVSLVAFILVYGLLGAAGYYLIYRKATHGPEPAAA